jgi:phosphoribosyl 1,2-cyclic phosphate phosphodiesterase
MNTNKITLLGTGTSVGIPMVGCKCIVCKSEQPKNKRLRTSAYIEYEGKNFLIDIGPDFRQQMLNNQIENIDAILITHPHFDHIGGYDDIRGFNFSQEKPIKLSISVSLCAISCVKFAVCSLQSCVICSFVLGLQDKAKQSKAMYLFFMD